MTGFIVTLLLSFVIIAVMALLINYCRRRLRRTRHGLTGMCHKSGGPVCPSCRDDREQKKSHGPD